MKSACSTEYIHEYDIEDFQYLCMGMDKCCNVNLLSTDPDTRCFKEQKLKCGGYLFCNTLAMYGNNDGITGGDITK